MPTPAVPNKTEVSAVLNLRKRKSETPLATIERYVHTHPEYKKVTMTYAGRLDPMAEGVLVVLAGDKNKERGTYTALDKDYAFEFILGVATDTYDVLGKVVSHTKDVKATEEAVRKALAKYTGTFVQAYPAFSSKVVDGKALFEHAKAGSAAGMELPRHEVSVRKIALVGTRTLSKSDLERQIATDVSRMKGDFRQEETLALWKAYFESAAPAAFTVFKAEISCGSGFYVRQLVSDIGKDLGTGAVTISILRTRVGKYLLEDAVVL